MGGKLVVVAGAQLGSEGKGHVTGQLSTPERVGSHHAAVVRVAGPNAGHTYHGVCPTECRDSVAHDDGNGHPWRLRAVPVGAVSNPNATLVIAAGSEIDTNVLLDEVTALDDAGYSVSQRMHVDRQATRLDAKHIDAELIDGIQDRLGSTAKGIGAARAERIWRHAALWGEYGSGVDTTAVLQHELRSGTTVIIEGTQGYGLGLHAGGYPFSTSSDCRAIDFLAMAGLSPWSADVDEFEVWLVARVRPIRVAGNSGPLAGETSWAELALPEERTTVTNKIRRVGVWDGDMVAQAVAANGGAPVVRLALTMVDTLWPELAGVDGNWADVMTAHAGVLTEVERYVSQVEAEVGAPVRFIGTGPTTGIWSV